MRARRISCALLFFVALGGATTTACDRPPSDDEIHEWTPADHDRSEENARVASGAQATATPHGEGGRDDNRQIVELTWRSQCASCHGAVGHGDGPQGGMVKAADLTNSDWQRSVTDQQLAESITTGKGRMPRFDLSPVVVAGLVQRIRASRGR
jgi:mono/diheme cytochrome c family protein